MLLFGGDAFLDRSFVCPSVSASPPAPAPGEVLLPLPLLLGLVSEVGAAISMGSPAVAGAGAGMLELEEAAGAADMVLGGFVEVVKSGWDRVDWSGPVAARELGRGLSVSVAICPTSEAHDGQRRR